MVSVIPIETLHRWEIPDFCDQSDNDYGTEELFISNAFNLEFSSTQFAMFYKASDSEWAPNEFGIILERMENMQHVEFDLKIWFENPDGEKFGERSVQNYILKYVGARCKFGGLSDNDVNLINAIYASKKNLVLCCEVIQLNGLLVLPTSVFRDKLLQNHWSLFEKGIHDAVIKVGDTEFKVLKYVLMAQSPVFMNMFMSNFKESQTSTIEVKDVDEPTMKQLIKWIYSGHIDDKSFMESLYAAADKYDIDLLKSFCVQSMVATLDTSNAFERLILAVLHNDDSLKNICLNELDSMPNAELSKCYSSDELVDLVQKCPQVAEEVSKLLSRKLKK